MTPKRAAATDEALGLPNLDHIEPRPAEPADPDDEALGLRTAADVAHRPSLAGIEHLVDPSLPRPQRRPRRSGHDGEEPATG